MVQLDKQHSTEEKILMAARQIFIDRGMDGARMQDIADAAGINKAMLHYYFRSKEKLYGTIVQHIMSNALPTMFDLLESDLKLKDKLKQFIINYLALIRANPFLPLFILNEMNRHPDKFVKWLPIKNLKISRFSDQVNEAVSLKLIRPIEPKVLIMNMASLIVFPFIARPMMCVVLKMDKKYFDQLLSQREDQIIDFVISAIYYKN